MLAARWWSHPDLFPDHLDGFSADPRPLDRATLSAGVTFPARDGEDDVDLTFRGAHAHLTTNTAGAVATFWICHGDPPLGYGAGPLERSCQDPTPLEPGVAMTYSPAPGSAYVVVTLAPTRAGETRLDRVDLDYSLGPDHLFQRGTESIAMDVRLRAE